MESRHWGHATWTELEELGLVRGRAGGNATTSHGSPVLALLPVGAIEAHGPHLPLETDVVIAAAAAKAALPGLRALDCHPIILPPLAYTAAPFAAGFPGTISLRPATFTALLADVAALVVVNAHLDPAHLAAIRDAAAAHEGPMPVVHPDLTTRRWASRLTAEFKSGACHAGCYESSVVMAAAPDLVRDEVRRALPENPASLSVAIGAGAATFEEAGVRDAYCGDPAAASPEEGRATIEVLGRIVVDAVADAVAERLGALGQGALETVKPEATG